MGIRGSKGTTPTEPLRCNSANETLEQGVMTREEDVSGARMQKAGELLTNA